MTIDETKKVIQKIKTFRPFFQTGNSSSEEINFRKEWHRVLESYDYEDVDRKLNEYFKDGDNVGRIPDAYYLVKFLKTHEEKQQAGGTTDTRIRPYCRMIRVFLIESEVNYYGNFRNVKI